ncbi:MAG: DNA-formamidopyrimidine glycosylase family protein [Chloroflexota bacterium]|nr:DNA-formamidopyrimidine glycosylase family protein [Chloroflexota bacterium]
MPELPDVEALRQYLQATSLHQEIEDVEVRAARLVASDEMSERAAIQALEEALVGRSFTSTRRHGKYLLVALDGREDKSLVLHFDMTGGLKYFEDMAEEPEYDRVLFHFANGYHLAYQSMRKLGEVRVVDDVEAFIDEKGLGPDALDPGLDLAAFKKAVGSRRAMTKSVLMDQGTIAGIGNVYSDEILFQARVHPRTKINKLDEKGVEVLFHAMKDVLQKGIACQAESEQFPESFIIPHRHEGGECPRCGTELGRVQVSSRHAYYCPNCQQKKGS